MRIQNRELNRKLGRLIQDLDEQSQEAFLNKEIQVKGSYERSTMIVTGLVISAIILLVFSYLIIQRDIREKEKKRKRLEETVKQNASLLDMRKNIILTISHDICVPLNVIGGSAELAMDIRDKKQSNNHLNNIRIVCRHITHLLNNLLDVYRLNEAKEARNDVPFSLNDLLERTVSGFTHIVNNKVIDSLSIDVVIIDKSLIWYGSVNYLGYNTDKNNAIRICDSKMADQILEALYT